ncbi:MAG: M56 family metallopeptidase [Longimicrobiaceae bacterium]
MSSGWMLQALLVGTLLGLGALAAERVAGWLGLPRRPVWAAAMLGSLLLPTLALWAPGLLPDLGIFPIAAPPVPAFDAGTLPLPANGPTSAADLAAADAVAWWADLPILLGVGWLTASLAMLTVVGWTYRRLRIAREKGTTMELDGGAVRVTDCVGPAVVGLLHPAVVVPRWLLDAPAEERRLVLLHEREHVAAGDAWLLFLGTLAVAAMPWSVPLWWQHRRLRAAVETDCDARVLARGADRRAYGRVLIGTAGCAPGLPLLGPAWGDTPSQLERRIVAMTAKRPSHPLLRSVALAGLVACMVATACDVAGKGGEASPSLATAPTARAATRAAWTPAPAVDRPFDVPGTVTTDTVVTGEVDRSKLPRPTASLGWYPRKHSRPVSGGRTLVTNDEYPVVSMLRMGGGAWKAGVREGDRVIAVDGRDGRMESSMFRLLFREPGDRYTVRIRRGGMERDFVVQLDRVVQGQPFYY